MCCVLLVLSRALGFGRISAQKSNNTHNIHNTTRAGVDVVRVCETQALAWHDGAAAFTVRSQPALDVSV